MTREVELHVVKCHHCGKTIGFKKPNQEQLAQIGLSNPRPLYKGLLLHIGWHIPCTDKMPYICPDCWPNVKYSYRDVGEVICYNKHYIAKYKEVVK